MKKIGIGADLGGTHIVCAAIDLESGNILNGTVTERPINSSSSALAVLSEITDTVNYCINKTKSEIEGIGIAIPGPFDYDQGVSKIKNLDKFETLFGVNIKHYLKSHLKSKVPSRIEFINDAEAFALGEYCYGSAREFNNVLAITLGTGFGSTFIKNNVVIKSGAGIPDGGFLYNQHFLENIADDYFSTRWFQKAWLTQTGKKCHGVKELDNLAEAGDENALVLFAKFGINLADFLHPWITESKTECLVVGGSISKAWNFFIEYLINRLSEHNINIDVRQTDHSMYPALSGAASQLKQTKISDQIKLRKTTQLLAPVLKVPDKKGDYGIYPGFKVNPNSIWDGFETLADWIAKHNKVIIDGYAGVFWDKIKDELGSEFQKKGLSVIWHETDAALKDPDTIDKMIEPWLGGDDPIFGKRAELMLADFFNPELLQSIKPDNGADLNIVSGAGAALSGWDAPIIYFDLPKNELQFRMRAKAISNLGAQKAREPKAMYKRFYFIDWPVLNCHKKDLIPEINIIVDDQRHGFPVWTTGDNLRESLHEMSRNFFRVRPWFEPGPWGGTWMKENINGLSQDVPNYAWSFELIVPENGILLEDNGKILEVSFDMLMFQEYQNVLGEAAERFGYEFPIRFDYLDTFDGGNLSIQCHPKEDYIKEHFGENFTQDETYYILDTKNSAEVYLGFQENIDAREFRNELEKSIRNSTEMDIRKFVQAHPSSKHDLFLIPNSTIHGSGKDNLVLEISSTPYIFTFKLYDWLRLDLNGKQRTLNIKRGFENLDFTRKGRKVKDEFISKPVSIEKGDDWELFHLPTHPEHSYDIHRYQFFSELEIDTNNQCHILMLVEGTSILLETVSRLNQRFNYAETFVVPAATKSYRIINEGEGLAMVIKAFVKSEKK